MIKRLKSTGMTKKNKPSKNDPIEDYFDVSTWISADPNIMEWIYGIDYKKITLKRLKELTKRGDDAAKTELTLRKSPLYKVLYAKK